MKGKKTTVDLGDGYTFTYWEGDAGEIEFPKGEPKYWHTEADIRAKVIEVCVNEYVARIPLMTILGWFREAREDMR